jgi:hypothetical protein
MTPPIEHAIIETLRISGPCCLDEVLTHLPDFSWGGGIRRR